MYRIAITAGAILVLATTVAVRQTSLSLLDIGAPILNVTKTVRTALLPDKASPKPATPTPQAGKSSGLTFDVVNIDPRGSSVFAGQAPSNSSVSVQANGRVVATVTADETGAWAIFTDRKLAAGEYEFSLSAQSPQLGVTVGQSVRLVIAPTPPNVSSDAKREAASSPSIPAPITFVYNDTTFTAEGRRAADSLAQHLIAQHPVLASLSGHADERGSDQFNMELSRRRLSVVADHLRDRGFLGKLELIPKGRSEPYLGVDRNALPREEVLQLDRRVELLHTH
jgi:outer membrane protein OmpA-like peptidoglycan-associated protein